MNGKMMSKGIQCRVQNSDYHIHVQAIGPIETNRPYGGAWELRAPNEVIEWCGEQSPVFKSAASNGVYYVRMEVLMFETGAQALLIHGKEFNHPKGLMMGCNPKSPAVKAVIEYAYQIDITSDAVFNDKVSDIVLMDAPVVLEETDTQEDGSHDLAEMIQSMVEKQKELDDKGKPLAALPELTGVCHTCGDKHDGIQAKGNGDIVSCFSCGTSMCFDCYYTPQDCEHCQLETHGGVMVWCSDCVHDPEKQHKVECPQSNPDGHADMSVNEMHAKMHALGTTGINDESKHPPPWNGINWIWSPGSEMWIPIDEGEEE